jgi:hypothetical protein
MPRIPTLTATVLACAVGIFVGCGGETKTVTETGAAPPVTDTGPCLVNGYGNELCGSAAESYCQMQEANPPPVTYDGSTADAWITYNRSIAVCHDMFG